MSERAIQNGYLIAAQSDIENLRARIAALESVARAADRMRGEIRATNQPGEEGFSLDLHDEADAYDSARAALGEIGGE